MSVLILPEKASVKNIGVLTQLDVMLGSKETRVPIFSNWFITTDVASEILHVLILYFACMYVLYNMHMMVTLETRG